MPTGVEEFIAAIAAALAEGAALAPFTGQPPTAAISDATAAAAHGSDPIPDVEMLEGQAVVTNAGSAGGGGSGSAPVTGDRPAASTSTAEAAPGELRGAWTFEPAFLDVDKGPAAAAQPAAVPAPTPPAADPSSAASSATGTSGSGTVLPPPPPPGSPPVPIGTPTFAAPPGAPPTGLPAVAPPAASSGGVGPAQSTPGAPPAVAPGSAPPAAARPAGSSTTPDAARPPAEEPDPEIEAPADIADLWERHVTLAPSKLIFGRSGEQLSEDLKKEVRNVVGAVIVTGDDPEESEGVQIFKQGNAAAVQTIADVFIDAAITPILDPGAPIRGILRTGVATPTGIEEVRQAQTPAETAIGAAKVVGEVSSVVLMVVAPIEGASRPGPRPTVGEPSITMHLDPPAAGIGERVTGGHVRMEIRTAAGDTITTHALPDATPFDIVPGTEQVVGGDVVVNAVTNYPTPPPGTNLTSFTRALTPQAAADAAAAAQAAEAGDFMGVPGGLGVRSAFGEHCGTYGAAIARAAGLPVVGIFGSRVAFAMFKATGIVTIPVSTGVVHAGVENTASRGSDAVPP